MVKVLDYDFNSFFSDAKMIIPTYHESYHSRNIHQSDHSIITFNIILQPQLA